MATYRITNRTSGADMGIYSAETEWGALCAMAQDGGAEAPACGEEWQGTWIVAEIPELSDDEIETFQAVAGAHGDRAMVETCDRALEGDWRARAEVAEALADAKAMA